MRLWLIAAMAALAGFAAPGEASAQKQPAADAPLPPPRPKALEPPAQPEAAAPPAPALKPAAPPPSRQRESPWFVSRQTLPASITMRCVLESGVEVRFVYDRATAWFRLEPGGEYRVASSRFHDDMLVLQAAAEGDVALSARIGARSFISMREGEGRLRLLPCFDLDAPQ